MKRTLCRVIALLNIAMPMLSLAQNPTDAKQVFGKNCVVCHGADGHAQTEIGKRVKAADLTSPAIQNQSNAQIREILARGKGKMPAYGPALGEKGLDAMLAYIRSLKAK